jgi:catechol 2,3-dioxygenase-like lactoylglutathione lyase family enzyme
VINGWTSLRVPDPRAVAQWYEKLGFEIVGEHPGIGIAVGTKEKGRVLVLLQGEPVGHPDRVQMHFAVADVDSEYERLKPQGSSSKNRRRRCPGGGMPIPVIRPATRLRSVRLYRMRTTRIPSSSNQRQFAKRKGP